jgi:1-acyl-sn-glycerol-3-phosphate acyltransferase
MTLYPLYKYVIYIPWLLLWTATNFMGVVLVAPFSRRYASRWFGRLWGRGLMYLVPARIGVLGKDELDSSQPYIVVSNHLSLTDIPVLYGWLPLDLKWVVKKELRRVPFIGAGCALMGHIFLDRDNRALAIQQLQQGERELPPGTSVMFFAEGTRSRNGKLQAFKKGPFQMAKDLQIAILPITLCKTDNILPPDGMGLRPGVAQMIINPPIPAAMVVSLNCEELRDRARSIIASNLTG